MEKYLLLFWGRQGRWERGWKIRLKSFNRVKSLVKSKEWSISCWIKITELALLAKHKDEKCSHLPANSLPDALITDRQLEGFSFKTVIEKVWFRYWALWQLTTLYVTGQLTEEIVFQGLLAQSFWSSNHLEHHSLLNWACILDALDGSRIRSDGKDCDSKYRVHMHLHRWGTYQDHQLRIRIQWN